MSKKGLALTIIGGVLTAVGVTKIFKKENEVDENVVDIEEDDIDEIEDETEEVTD